jgi:hypothetical protein
MFILPAQEKKNKRGTRERSRKKNTPNGGVKGGGN